MKYRHVLDFVQCHEIGSAISGILQGWHQDSNELNSLGQDAAQRLKDQAAARSDANKFQPVASGGGGTDPDVAKLETPPGSVSTEESFSPAIPQGQRLSDILGDKAQNPSPMPQTPSPGAINGSATDASGGSPGVGAGISGGFGGASGTGAAAPAVGQPAAKSGISSSDLANYGQLAGTLGSLLQGPPAASAGIPQPGSSSYTPTAAAAQARQPGQGMSLQDAMARYQQMSGGGGGGMI